MGGFAKALRTIPAMLALGRALEAQAPRAVLVNFTNPSGLVTEAMLRHTNVNTIGLCNIPVTFQLELARALRAAREDIALDYVGLNHLSWVRDVRRQGEDVTAKVLAWAGQTGGPACLRDLEYPPEFIRALGMVPMPYLRYFYLTDRMIADQKGQARTRAEEVMEIEAELMKIYADPASDRKPELLSRRGGANYSLAALTLIESIHFNRGDVQIVDAQNRGTIGFLPDAAVIEAPCRIDRDGASPLPARPLPPAIAGLVAAVKAYEDLTVQAAVEGSYDKALLALVTHPLGPDAGRARAVLDDILMTHNIQLDKV